MWTATGTLLATGTFTNETASGWQTLSFASPVAVTAGTSYVAGYHSNGHYAVDANYFNAPVSNGPLTADTSRGGPSFFSYSTSSIFPTGSGTGDNYWVDVVFAPSGANLPPVANSDSGFTDTENTALTIAASALLANDTDPNGLPLSISGVSNPTNGTVAFNASTNIVTFTPTTGYTGPASFAYTITDLTGLTSSATVSLSVTVPGAASLWTTTTTPTTLSENDPNQVELGVKFSSSSAGTITGLRYYKSANDAGTHTGSLWTSTGTLLGSATFTNETASGWQTVNFTTPIAIAAGTTYVAAYHSNGNYADSANYFTTAHTSGPLTAPASGTTGNGVYTYSSSNVFPTSSFSATNYWVDVLFQPGSLPPPVANADSGLVATENSALVIQASTLLANDTDPNGLALSITGVSNPTNGTVAFNATAKTITFTPTAGYTGPASFAYAIADTAGGTASANVALTVNAPAPPVATNDSGFKVAENTALAIAASALLANDTDPNGLPLSISAVSNPTNGTVAFNASTNTITFTPTTGYTGPASFTYTITDTAGATASANVALTVNAPTPPVANADSGFNDNENTVLSIAASALLANDTDPNGLALSITGVSNPTNGTVAFNASTNTVTFTPTTGYTGPASFTYTITDTAGGTASANVALTVNAPKPPVANNDTGFTDTQNTALTIAASALLANDTDPNGLPLSISGVSNPTNGTVAFNASTNIVTFTPTTGYTGPASFAYTITDLTGLTSSATVSLTVAAPGAVSLWTTTTTPTVLSENDPNQVELGVKFSASSAGLITGLRYYRSANDPGTHVGSLWTSTGTLLGSATFTNETASGWQTVNFATPIAIAAGTTYVAAYHSNGNYADSANYFTTAHTTGPLTALASGTTGNGVYAYGSSSVFPTSSFSATNYWVDVLFQPGTLPPPVATPTAASSRCRIRRWS